MVMNNHPHKGIEAHPKGAGDPSDLLDQGVVHHDISLFHFRFCLLQRNQSNH